MKSIVIFSLLLILPIGNAFAQSVYDINIPTGAASPDAPYFWQSEKDGRATGDIDVLVGDSVIWKNADTTMHTVTSGTPDNPDGYFDSNILGPGKTFKFTFLEKGKYSYYCIPHPWMIGTVTVTEGYQIIPDVGKTVGDGSAKFDIEYKLNRVLSVSSIDVEQKAITFALAGVPKTDQHNLHLRLPSDLIDGPFAIWIDNKKSTEYEHVREGDLHILDIPLEQNSKTMTIVGTAIVPEFGAYSVFILFVAIIITIAFVSKTKLVNRFSI